MYVLPVCLHPPLPSLRCMSSQVLIVFSLPLQCLYRTSVQMGRRRSKAYSPVPVPEDTDCEHGAQLHHALAGCWN
uniref:Uncharacterized protein n=1 Tax=Aegilops tauschii subsp. strangulata TaxID=200361 RepID=A0A453RDU2_AEGTS